MGRRCRSCVDLLVKFVQHSDWLLSHIERHKRVERRLGAEPEKWLVYGLPEEVWRDAKSALETMRGWATEFRECLPSHAKGVLTRALNEMEMGIERRSYDLLREGVSRINVNSATYWPWHVAEACQREVE